MLPSEIKSRYLQALAEIAAEELITLRDRLDVAYPPAGPVGGYPARRTGILRDGVDVRLDGSQIVFSSSADYSKYVEKLRPFLDLASSDLARTLPSRLKSKLNS